MGRRGLQADVKEVSTALAKLDTDADVIKNSAGQTDSTLVSLSISLKALCRMCGRIRQICKSSSTSFKNTNKTEVEALEQRSHLIVQKLISVKMTTAWNLMDTVGVFELIKGAVATNTVQRG